MGIEKEVLLTQQDKKVRKGQTLRQTHTKTEMDRPRGAAQDKESRHGCH